MRYSFDPAKQASNLGKHGFDLADAKKVIESGRTVTFEDRRWVFPRGDCVLLPIPNTTAELLARYIGQRLLAAFAARIKTTPERLRLEVDENLGQWGCWEWNVN